MAQIDEIFSELTALKRWVPYRMVFDAHREKFDKIPHNGRHGLSTAQPDDWLDFTEAATTAQANALPGVGIVLTGGIEVDEWRLVGLDYDGVDFDNFVPPFQSYTEVSPSGKGARSLAWVPNYWAAQYNDCSNAHPAGCEHAEIYLGNRPRFLTITFNPILEAPIARLDAEALDWLAQWLKPITPTDAVSGAMPSDAGVAVDLRRYATTHEQLVLIGATDSVNKIDRSAVLHGLLIQMIDANVTPANILATILQNAKLWQMCLDHRHENPFRATDFAREEIRRAYDKSMKAKRDRLVGFNMQWKTPEPTEGIDAPSNKAPANDRPLLPFPPGLFEQTPGLVGEIAHWIMRASFSPREEFAYACALSVVACLVGPYCTHGTRGSKLGLYICLVGGTGTGKNEAIDVAAMLMQATEARDAVQDFPASEAALRRQLNVTPNILLRVDELAHKLESMASNANGSNLSRAILEAYNGARMPPKTYADEKKCLPAVENPFVQILGGTTDKIWSVVKSSHMDDGTLNRFLFVCLPEMADYSRQLEPDATIPKELKDKLNAFWREGKRLDLLGFVPPGFGRHLEYSDEVRELLIDLDESVWKWQQREYGSLYTRYTLHVLKVAGIIAVGDGRSIITAKDFKMADKFVGWCGDSTYRKIADNMADSQFERTCKRLLSKLMHSDGGKMTMRAAYKVMHISRREMEEVINTLILAGDVIVYESKFRNGRVGEYVALNTDLETDE